MLTAKVAIDSAFMRNDQADAMDVQFKPSPLREKARDAVPDRRRMSVKLGNGPVGESDTVQ